MFLVSSTFVRLDINVVVSLRKQKFDQQYAVTWKLCEIECKLVIFTNKESHMSFQLVPKSVTLNDHTLIKARH